ncbi:MAG: hypothetical protein R3B94_08605 [Hyphomonas sp.]
MSAATQSLPSKSRLSANTELARDIAGVFAREKLKPTKATIKATGKVVAEVAAAVSKLTAEQRRRVLVQEEALADAIEALVEELAARTDIEPQPVKVTKSVERHEGKGLGKKLTVAEGRKRLLAYATPQRIEDWAGDVAGATEIERTLGISRSTLHYWNTRGDVVGLQKGTRNRVYPLAQFIDERPVEGIDEVLNVIKNPRATWQWLIQHKPSIKGTPLDLLKEGEIGKVVKAAERDFG